MTLPYLAVTAIIRHAMTTLAVSAFRICARWPTFAQDRGLLRCTTCSRPPRRAVIVSDLALNGVLTASLLSLNDLFSLYSRTRLFILFIVTCDEAIPESLYLSISSIYALCLEYPEEAFLR